MFLNPWNHFLTIKHMEASLLEFTFSGVIILLTIRADS